MNTDPRAPATPAQRGGATTWALVGSLAIAGFFLLTEHRAHLFGALPYLLLLACPLLHFFRHHRHRSHVHHDRTSSSD